MANLFKKVRAAASNYVGSVSGDANQIKDTLSKFGSAESISNMFDHRIADGLTDLLTGVTGIRTSNIPEISDQVLQTKSVNREARNAVLNNAMSGRASTSPSEGKILKYPEDFAAEDGTRGPMTNYIHFRSLKRRAISVDDNEQVYDIFLYVPNELADDITVEYNESKKGLIEGAVASLFSEGPISNQVADRGEIFEILKAGAPGADILKATAGKTINPLKFQLFEGVSFRTYSYTFDFRPLNAKDSTTIQEIIYAFRKSMLPGTEGDNSRIYTFPNEWAIRYHGLIKRWVDYPMVTVCTKASVNWAPAGVTQHLDGAPTNVTLSLSFSELTTLDRTKFDKRVSGYVNGSGYAREVTQEGGSIGDINTATLADTVAAARVDADADNAPVEQADQNGD